MSLRIPEAGQHKSVKVVQVEYATQYNNNHVLYVHAFEKCKFGNLN